MMTLTTYNIAIRFYKSYSRAAWSAANILDADYCLKG
jgi:hypothetical protein